MKNSFGIENVRLIFAVAGLSRDKQVADIQRFIHDKVDVIAFSPVVETGYDDVLRQAKAAGIPVILTDRVIKTADPGLYLSSIGSNFTAEGSSAAVWVKGEFRNSQKPVNIVELEGTAGSAPAVQRKAGFREGLGDDERFRIVATPNGNFSRSEGEAAMKTVLKTQHDIDVVFAQNDDMGIGALTAIQAAGKRPGKDIKVVTIDAIHDGLTALAEGKINYVVECNPLIGPQLVALIKDVYLGIRVPRRVDTDETVFFPENVRDYINDREY
ncbi:ABC transporter substrate-binding protein [Actinoplanes sp. KI2]|uniref:ABC transporter substrate-binding protein n=1 Tax=Actinoplanes sp. KI2 TaxID=2983315 RepID=UPI0021D5F8B0|nr:ABC transporter substrate-binding protein [Actinoplanes sp. KI2]MCU7727994.1 ABC transporter substrate-binding protein [Actinoplanes sp. KI2]